MKNIENIKTADLIPYINNAKKHSEKQIGMLASSIKNWGFNNPILIDKGNEIIAGHGRLLAAQKLRLETVPCIRLEHLSDAERKAYCIADNRLAEIGTEWDEQVLMHELDSIDLPDGIDFEFEFADEETEQIEKAKEIKETFEVVAECENEDMQRMVFNILEEKGISCRLATF